MYPDCGISRPLGGCANVEPPPFFREVVQTPHSVVTAHFVDEQGHPTRVARDEILEFLRTRLHSPEAG